MNEAASPARTNAAIARAYDALLYDMGAATALDPPFAFGIGALHGCARSITKKFDVLDLGCGAGAQLERLAGQTRGLLVGVDISPAHCDIARKRLSGAGGRVQILDRDFLDIEPGKLGTFDLIINLGVIFVTPPAARARILEIIGKCLAPGGVAILSYYAGDLPKRRSEIHRALRVAIDPGADYATQVATARATLAGFHNEHPPGTREHTLLDLALKQTAAQPDTIFYHEALNQAFEPQDTSALEAALAPYGVSFLTYLELTPNGVLATSRDRALAADAMDREPGGYRYAFFGKVNARDSAADARRPQVRWASRLVNPGVGVAYQGPAIWRDRRDGRAVRVDNPATQAALDEIGDGVKNFAQLLAGARNRLSRAGVKPGADIAAVIAGDLLQLAWGGFLAPLWKES